MNLRFLQIVDGFYASPSRIRRHALRMTYSEPEEFVGWRTQGYHPNGIRDLIEKKFKIKISYWEQDITSIEACNGVFFRALSRGPYAEKVGVHYDEPPHWVMLLIYLTPDAPYTTGTSFWQHRQTGLISKPTRRDAERLGIPLVKLEELVQRDGRHRRRWIEIDRVGNVYNRAVLFPGGLFHSATSHFGTNQRNGRLYQTFHFPLSKDK